MFERYIYVASCFCRKTTWLNWRKESNLIFRARNLFWSAFCRNWFMDAGEPPFIFLQTIEIVFNAVFHGLWLRVAKLHVFFATARLQWCGVQLFGVRAHQAEAMNSNPARFTIESPASRKATGNHLTKSSSLEKARALYLLFAPLKFGYSMGFFGGYEDALDFNIGTL